METYNYKNISLNISTLDPDWIDLTGETMLTLKSDFVSELCEYCCSFQEYFLRFDFTEIFIDELEEDEEKAAKYFKELDQDVEVRNADAIIAVYEYCLKEDERKFEFYVETENISWPIHDMLHAVHDAAGCTIYVENEIERERILKSLSITKELFPHLLPDWVFLDNLEDEFYLRFKEHLDLEEFKYLELEEEY